MSEIILKSGVIGWPIDHSLSPRLFGYWLKKNSVNGFYKAYAVQKDDINEFLCNMSKLGLVGLNVTVPHKQEVMKYVDHLSDCARKVGAVNTITKKDGLLFGDNTDGYGFIENLRQNYGLTNAFNGDCIVIGAGGAARAIVYALINIGAKKIKIVNRTQSKAEKLAKDIGGPIDVIDWNKRHNSLTEATFVVNTTTLGMKGNPPLELNLSALPKKALINDIVYVPVETTFLRNARARGNPTVDGIGMLLHQARPGFAEWFNKDPLVTEDLRHYVLGINGG